MKLSEQLLSLTSDPNILGELLRDMFFKQDRQIGSLGGYDIFEFRDNVVKLPDEKNLDCGGEEGVTVTVAQLDDVIMKLFWDGDGDLTFYLQNDILANCDCKKTHGWEAM